MSKSYNKYRAKKKRLENKTLKLWKELILEKNPVCECCQEKKSHTAHHYYYRSSYGHLIFDIDNGIGICTDCHCALHHQDPKKYTEKIEKHRSKKWRERIKKKARNRPVGTYKTLTWIQEQQNKLNKLNKLL